MWRPLYYSHPKLNNYPYTSYCPGRMGRLFGIRPWYVHYHLYTPCMLWWATEDPLLCNIYPWGFSLFPEAHNFYRPLRIPKVGSRTVCKYNVWHQQIVQYQKVYHIDKGAKRWNQQWQSIPCITIKHHNPLSFTLPTPTSWNIWYLHTQSINQSIHPSLHNKQSQSSSASFKRASYNEEERRRSEKAKSVCKRRKRERGVYYQQISSIHSISLNSKAWVSLNEEETQSMEEGPWRIESASV